MSPDLRHELGRLGERLALEHLQRLGLVLLDRNYRTRHGELDIVVCDARTIVFVEVKTRRAGSGSPWEALRPAKRSQVRRMATTWLAQRRDRPRCPELRFDAIGIQIDARGALVALDHLEGAF